MKNKPLARILIRLDKYNPRRFIVKDRKKLELYEMLSKTELGKWDKGHGIRIERWKE